MKRQIFKAKFEEIEKPPRITPWRLLTYLVVCERIRTFYPLHPMQVLVNSTKPNKSSKST
jgi:hypothetical protein